MQNKKNIDFNKNEDNMKLLIGNLKHHIASISLGGGKKAIEKHRKKGKLTARERIAKLIDKGTEFIEYGTLDALNMYPD